MDAIEISIQLWNWNSRGYRRGGVVAFLMVFVVSSVSAQGSVFQTDSAKTRSHIWVDGGFYPIQYSGGGDFQPCYTIRGGWGEIPFLVPFSVFLEYTHYTFSPHSGLLTRTYSHARYDIALYTAFTPLSFFFFGVGMYYMHHDDVVDQWMVGTSTSYEIHSGVRSHVALYYLVGVYYTVSLSPLLSFSFGCYWRNQDRRTSDNVFPQNTSLRVGLMYTVGK